MDFLTYIFMAFMATTVYIGLASLSDDELTTPLAIGLLVLGFLWPVTLTVLILIGVSIFSARGLAWVIKRWITS